MARTRLGAHDCEYRPQGCGGWVRALVLLVLVMRLPQGCLALTCLLERCVFDACMPCVLMSSYVQSICLTSTRLEQRRLLRTGVCVDGHVCARARSGASSLPQHRLCVPGDYCCSSLHFGVDCTWLHGRVGIDPVPGTSPRLASALQRRAPADKHLRPACIVTTCLCSHEQQPLRAPCNVAQCDMELVPVELCGRVVRGPADSRHRPHPRGARESPDVEPGWEHGAALSAARERYCQSPAVPRGPIQPGREHAVHHRRAHSFVLCVNVWLLLIAVQLRHSQPQPRQPRAPRPPEQQRPPRQPRQQSQLQRQRRHQHCWSRAQALPLPTRTSSTSILPVDA